MRLMVKIVVFFLSFQIFSLMAANSQGEIKVLFLHSYPPSEWPEMITKGTIDNLEKNFRHKISYEEFYLGNELLDKVFANYQEKNLIIYKDLINQFRVNFQEKVAAYKPDYVIVSDDEAVFLVQDILPKISGKIYFTGINSLPESSLFLDRRILEKYNYINETIPIENTVSILKKYSEIENILVLTSEGFSSKIIAENLRGKKDIYLDKHKIKKMDFIISSQFKDWEKCVKNAHKNYDLLIVLVPYHVVDNNKKEVGLMKIGDLLDNNLKIPSLGISPIHIKMGMLMGVCPSPYYLGKQVSELVISEINNVLKRSGPVYNIYNELQVNQGVLKKFPIFNRPELTEIINLQGKLSIKEKNKEYSK
ncbi:MAG: hypothetical protein HQK50_08455 [Oligoflexia bacterium]|nr:hypothetical protein [Oligoflexia bacterium]